ncbi:type II toxin-antitoxin system Phd/YefM family antitoxin [Patescibacteria group bacterium]|nr:type II toxin-antitoxin system Phd/YefM family antitoxin [Patescibacteria group bacterium]
MNWEKFLNLIKKTGDRLIVTDKDEGEAYVIMSLSEYEDLISKTDGAYDTLKQSESEIEQAPEAALASDFDPVKMESQDNLNDVGLSDEERFYLEPIE